MATGTIYRSRAHYQRRHFLHTRRYRDTIPPVHRKALYALAGLTVAAAFGLVLTVAPAIWDAL